MTREDLNVLPMALAGGAAGVFKYYIRPEITARRTWGLIGIIAVAHEVVCPPGELLSEGYDRGLEKYRTALTLGTLAITGHLLNAFGKYDPVHYGMERMINHVRR